MNVSKGVLLLELLIILPSGVEAKVRDLYLHDKTMETVHLKMGQSTVLRFSEKPKRVVIGNQNFFNVEFVENDVTIQPLGESTTNLFVYGEYQTYGLILNVDNSPYYDDLVFVKRGYPMRSAPMPTLKRMDEVKAELETTPKKEIEAKILKVMFHEGLKVYLLDFEVKNNGVSDIKTGDIEASLISSGKPLGDLKILFENDFIHSGENGKCRMIFKLQDKKGLVLTIKARGIEIKKEIQEKFL